MVFLGFGSLYVPWSRGQLPSHVRLDRWYWRRTSMQVKNFKNKGWRSPKTWNSSRLELWWVINWSSWRPQLRNRSESVKISAFTGINLADFEHEKDCLLKPVRVFPDPFRKLPNILVLCEVYNHEWSPIGTNHRYSCKKTMDKVADSKPWFGLEQEYTLLDHDGESFSWVLNRDLTVLRSPTQMAKTRFPRATGTLLLRCRLWQGLRSWCCRSTLQSLSLCRYPNIRNKCRSHACSMGISSWTMRGDRNGRSALDGKVSFISKQFSN